MLRAPEVCAKIQDEGLESGRIQQEGHGCLSRFEFLMGYDEHGWCLLFILFGLKIVLRYS